MNENIIAFLKKISEDSALQEKMKVITDPNEAYALASSVQEGFTQEEFITAMQQIKAQMEEAGELTDEDLAKTAGGSEIGKTFLFGLELGACGGVLAAGTVLAIEAAA